MTEMGSNVYDLALADLLEDFHTLPVAATLFLAAPYRRRRSPDSDLPGFEF